MQRASLGMAFAQCVSMLRHLSNSPLSRHGRGGKISHWWGIVRNQSADPSHFSRVVPAATSVEATASEGDEIQENDPEQTTATGSAVILDFDYLSEVYEVYELGLGEVCLSGPKAPPTGSFEVLIHNADGFVEYLASAQQTADTRWLLRLEAMPTPRFLQRPTATVGKHYVKRKNVKRKIG